MTPQMPDEPAPAPAAAADARAHISNARRYFLFAIFCIANLLDAYNLNAIFAGLPALKNAFGLSEVDASWVMSGFELTYASFLLIVSANAGPSLFGYGRLFVGGSCVCECVLTSLLPRRAGG